MELRPHHGEFPWQREPIDERVGPASADDRGALSRLVTDRRRFPPPWTVEETDACYIVRDANGQALARQSQIWPSCRLPC
jgi:hypothetical protein